MYSVMDYMYPKDYKNDTKHTYLILGNYKLKISNYGNKYFTIDVLTFSVNDDGTFSIIAGANKRVSSLNELKSIINVYRQTYKTLLTAERKNVMEGDFNEAD